MGWGWGGRGDSSGDLELGQGRCSLSSLRIVKPSPSQAAPEAPSQAAQEVGIQHVLLLGPRLSLTRSLSQTPEAVSLPPRS